MVMWGAAVQVYGGKLWVNLPTTFECPEYINNCTFANPAFFNFFTPPSAYDVLPRSISIPGGQQVYLAPDQSLSYSVAHAADIPLGSKTDGFQLIENAVFDATLKLDGHDFFAWPVDIHAAVNWDSVFQIYGGGSQPQGKGKCVSVGLAWTTVKVLAA